MGAPPELGPLIASEASLLATVQGLTDAEAAAPSLLPGWSRAELVTHLARNADGLRHVAEAAMRGEVGDQYPGGMEQRAADIATGRGKPAAQVVADLAQAVEWLHQTWAAMPDEAWGRPARLTRGSVTVADTVARRWLEVEVHRMDLDLGVGPDDWPLPFVDGILPRVIAMLPDLAAEPADGRWVLWADDLSLAWSVSSLAGGVTVSRFDESDPPPDVILRGPGGRLLAALLGRDDAGAGLKASGDPALAGGFSRWFRFP
ncbi:MAG TPA: maleylpyruvate isomerase family mycothiol-dependent enzyme [Acidimicrobiales bacterium]|nr:maleylpyruvate isomerase family mycothiol-dependent enzyme [Acidimicrobiales bacterium]